MADPIYIGLVVSSGDTTTLNTATFDHVSIYPYAMGGTCAAPTFCPTAGIYTAAQAVTISSTTSGATIRYTTDGSTPSETHGTVYSAPVNITIPTTLQAIAYASDMLDSPVTSGVYTIECATPTFSPAAGTYHLLRHGDHFEQPPAGRPSAIPPMAARRVKPSAPCTAQPVTFSATTILKAIAYEAG